MILTSSFKEHIRVDAAWTFRLAYCVNLLHNRSQCIDGPLVSRDLTMPPNDFSYSLTSLPNNIFLPIIWVSQSNCHFQFSMSLVHLIQSLALGIRDVVCCVTKHSAVVGRVGWHPGLLGRSWGNQTLQGAFPPADTHLFFYASAATRCITPMIPMWRSKSLPQFWFLPCSTSTLSARVLFTVNKLGARGERRSVLKLNKKATEC